MKTFIKVINVIGWICSLVAVLMGNTVVVYQSHDEDEDE